MLHRSSWRTYDRAKWRELSTLSGGEQKRLALEALLRGPDEVLLLDEPDNFLDVPAKRWLENQLQTTQKSVLLVSHDRELLAQTAQDDRSAGARRRGQLGLDPRLRIRDAWQLPGESDSPVSRSCGGVGTRSIEKLRELMLHVQEQGRLQLRNGLALSGRADPAGQVRGGRAASGGAAWSSECRCG